MHASEVELDLTILELRGGDILGKENTPGEEMVMRIIMERRDRLGVGNKFESTDQKH